MRTLCKHAGLASLVEADLQTASIRLSGRVNACRRERPRPAAQDVSPDGERHPPTVPARLDSGVYWVRVVRGANPGKSHEPALTVEIVGPVAQDN